MNTAASKLSGLWSRGKYLQVNLTKNNFVKYESVVKCKQLKTKYWLFRSCQQCVYLIWFIISIQNEG